MSIQDLPWDPIHASAYGHARSLLRLAKATPRPMGALRYRCPITGSFVLVTDETTLQWLARPNARLRCADCGELHLIGGEAAGPSAAALACARSALADDAKPLR
jgi:hypothetical protein